MKIKCVDNTLCSTLTLDKEYLVIEEAPEYYVVLDDVNNETKIGRASCRERV